MFLLFGGVCLLFVVVVMWFNFVVVVLGEVLVFKLGILGVMVVVGGLFVYFVICGIYIEL